MATKKIRMTNAELPGQDIFVPEGVVEGHRRMGWEVAKDDTPEQPAAEPPAADAPTTTKAAPRRAEPNSAANGKE